MSTDHGEVEYDGPPYRQMPDGLLLDLSVTGEDVRLWGLLAWHARGGKGAFPGRKLLAQEMGKSDRTVDACLNRLISAGWVSVKPRYRENGGRGSNLYTIHHQQLAEEKRNPDRLKDQPKKPQATPPSKPASKGGMEASFQGGMEADFEGALEAGCDDPSKTASRESNETNRKGEKEEERGPAADAASGGQAAAGGAEDAAGDDGALFGEKEAGGTAAKPSGRRRKAPLTPAPEQMVITLQMRQWARDNGITADLVMETAQFLDHHAAKGNEFRDWGRAWQTWMRNTLKYAPGARQGGGVPGNHLPYNPDDEVNEENRRAFG